MTLQFHPLKYHALTQSTYVAEFEFGAVSLAGVLSHLAHPPAAAAAAEASIGQPRDKKLSLHSIV